MENTSNSKEKQVRKKSKDILNANLRYLDVSYFNKLNTSLLKSNNKNTYNFSSSFNDEKFFKG